MLDVANTTTGYATGHCKKKKKNFYCLRVQVPLKTLNSRVVKLTKSSNNNVIYLFNFLDRLWTEFKKVRKIPFFILISRSLYFDNLSNSLLVRLQSPEQAISINRQFFAFLYIRFIYFNYTFIYLSIYFMNKNIILLSWRPFTGWKALLRFSPILLFNDPILCWYISYSLIYLTIRVLVRKF